MPREFASAQAPSVHLRLRTHDRQLSLATARWEVDLLRILGSGDLGGVPSLNPDS